MAVSVGFVCFESSSYARSRYYVIIASENNPDENEFKSRKLSSEGNERPRVNLSLPFQILYRFNLRDSEILLSFGELIVINITV